MSYLGIRSVYYKVKIGQCYGQIEVESMGCEMWRGTLLAGNRRGNFVKEAVPS